MCTTGNQALLAVGARADTRNAVLESVVFHGAVARADPALLKLLLRGVTDVNIQDGEGSSALHVCMESLLEADQETADRLVECAGLLVQQPGVELDTEDMKGEAVPLYYAALAGNQVSGRQIFNISKYSNAQFG